MKKGLAILTPLIAGGAIAVATMLLPITTPSLAESTTKQHTFKQGIAAHSNGDYATALTIFEQLAHKQNPGAQYVLGVMYANGNGVRQDQKASAQWLRLAAEQALPPAQFNLGIKYAQGQGVKQDFVEAHAWINLSGAYGHDGATDARDTIERAMTLRQIADAQIRAKQLFDEIEANRYR